MMVGFNRRFDPNFLRVREVIAAGKVGQPHMLRITSRDPGPPPEAYIRASGGIFLDMTIHDFDMARYLMGSEVTEVYTRAAVLVDPVFAKAGDWDTALVTLTFENGAFGSIDNSRKAVYGYDQRVEMFGSAGMVTVTNNTPDAHILADSRGHPQRLAAQLLPGALRRIVFARNARVCGRRGKWRHGPGGRRRRIQSSGHGAGGGQIGAREPAREAGGNLRRSGGGMSGLLNVGVIGLGRMGSVYARNLAHRVPNARLVAVSDHKDSLRQQFAAELGGVKAYATHQELLHDKDVEAVAIVTSTSTHKEVVMDAAASGKAIFCEKPMSLSLADAHDMQRAVDHAGVFLHMGFQRRFDAGYQAAKKKVDDGVIGDPIVMTSISRDPFRPPLEFCDPKVSGGLIADMGVHDFDLGRMFLGEVGDRPCGGRRAGVPGNEVRGRYRQCAGEPGLRQRCPGDGAIEPQFRLRLRHPHGDLGNQRNPANRLPAAHPGGGDDRGGHHARYAAAFHAALRGSLPRADPGFRGPRARRTAACAFRARRHRRHAHQPGGDALAAGGTARAGQPGR